VAETLSIESLLTLGRLPAAQEVAQMTRQILNSLKAEQLKAEILLRLYSLLSRSRLKMTQTFQPRQARYTD